MRARRAWFCRNTVCDLPGEITTLFKKIVQRELHWRRDGKIGVADELEPLQSGGNLGRGPVTPSSQFETWKSHGL